MEKMSEEKRIDDERIDGTFETDAGNQKEERDSSGIKGQLEKTGNLILTYSRRKLYLSLRFFAAALAALKPVMRQDIGTIGTDGVSLFFRTPSLVQMYSDNERLVHRAYIHVLLHLLLYHPFKEKKKNEEIWDLACDITVESIIDELDVNILRLPTSDLREDIYKKIKKRFNVFTAENIYTYLVKESIEAVDVFRLQDEFKRDEHILWKKKDKQNREKDDTDKEKKRWEQLNRKLSNEIDIYMRKQGKDPGTLVWQLKAENRRRQELGDFLRNFTVVAEENHLSDEEFDRNMYVYGMTNFDRVAFVEPLETKESKKISELVIAIDTSGSCMGESIKEFLEQTYAVLKNEESFFRKFKVHIIQADVRITREDIVTSMEEMEKLLSDFHAVGSGGTDFNGVFEYVNEKIRIGEIKNMNGLLYFTDGIGTYPKTCPAYKTAFVFLRKLGDVFNIEVPGWAQKLVLEEGKDINVFYRRLER